jgi:hypothetical protein
MPQYQVMFRAEELNNVATLQPMDIDAFEWAFRVCPWTFKYINYC